MPQETAGGPGRLALRYSLETRKRGGADASRLQPSSTELAAIVASYKDPDKSIFGTGFHVGGEKYVTIKADDRSLYGKKVRAFLPLAPR